MKSEDTRIFSGKLPKKQRVMPIFKRKSKINFRVLFVLSAPLKKTLGLFSKIFKKF